MNALGIFWSRYSRQFALRSARERALALVIAVAASALIGDRFFLQTREAELRTLRQREIALATPAASATGHPSAAAAVEQRRQMLVKDISRTETALRALDSELVPARDMKHLLDQLLLEVPGVRITRLHDLSPQALDAGDSAMPAGSQALHRHGFELVLQGSYPDLLRYLARVEALPQRVLWRQVQLDASDYPTDRMTIVIYTLSREAPWLSL